MNMTVALEQSITKTLQSVQQSLQGMAHTVTQYAADVDSNNNTSSSVPFATLPLFGALAQQSLLLQNELDLVAYAPRIPASDRLDWEQYAQANQLLLKSSARYDLTPTAVSRSEHDSTTSIYPYIFQWDDATGKRVDAPATTSGYFVPLWQVSMAAMNHFDSVNYNMPSLLGDSVWEAAGSGAIWSDMVESVPMMKESSPSGPVSFMIVPVYDNSAERSSTVAGYILGAVSWSTVLDNALATGSASGIVGVLESTCGSCQTYEWTGDGVRLVGHGDMHDAAYSDTAFSIWLTTGNGSSSSAQGACDYSLKIYSSANYEQSIETGAPWKVTLLVAGVVGFLALVFLLYDLYMTRHNNIVMDAATKSQAMLVRCFVKEKMFLVDTTRPV